MFKIVCKTQKIVPQAKLTVFRIFLCNFQMSTPFKYYFSNEHPILREKRGTHLREALIKYFVSGGGTNLREALFRVNMVYFLTGQRRKFFNFYVEPIAFRIKILMNIT